MQMYRAIQSVLFFAICFLISSNFVFADQLIVLTKEQAEKAQKALRLQSGKEIILYCGCCDQDPKRLFLLINTEIVPYEDNFYSIKFDAARVKNDSLIYDIVDLADVWIRKGNMAVCLGKELGFECDPCASSFAWKGDEPARIVNKPTPNRISNSPTVSKTTLGTSIDEIVLNANVWSPPKPPTALGVTQRKLDSVYGDGKRYQIVEKKYNRFERIESFAVIDPNRGSLWAGALIQGQNLQNGELSSIGSFARAPLTITMSGTGSRTVFNPSYATVTAAVRDILKKEKSSNSAQISISVAENKSATQTRCELGAKIGFLPFSFEGKFVTV
jgi:hypothetical protein